MKLRIVSTVLLLCLFVVSAIACSSNSSQSLPLATPTPTSAVCSCANINDYYDAGSCVLTYLVTEAATTLDGKQLQATLSDALDYSGAHDTERSQENDGGWVLDITFYPEVVDHLPALADILTHLSTWMSGGFTGTYYNTRWNITPEGCIEAIDGNAIRLLTALQN